MTTARPDPLTTPPSLSLYGVSLSSRLLLGTALYPSPKIMADSIKAAGAGIVTVSVRRESARARTAGACQPKSIGKSIGKQRRAAPPQDMPGRGYPRSDMSFTVGQ